MIKPRFYKKNIIRAKNAESIIINIINKFYVNGPIFQEELEQLAYIKKFHPYIFQKYESKILYLMGLFYKPLTPNSLVEMVYNAYSENIKLTLNNTFTPLQANMIKNIIDKKYFSFSAPTSSGKSYLFMDLIKNRDDDIVIIVPSRALIAEYLKKVLEIVKNKNDILVLQFVENINRTHTNRRIFILTPERARDLFRFKSVLNIGLFLIDEAQLSEEDLRGLTFDALIRRIDKTFPNATKIFAHPFISNPEAQLEKHHFIENKAFKQYKQNSVGKIYLTPCNSEIFAYRPTFKPEKFYYTRNIVKKILKQKNTTVLIYTSKKKMYDKKHLTEFDEYINLCPIISDKRALEIIKELQEYIGATQVDKISLLIEMMKKGVVIHHGSIPLKARFLIEQFINEGFAKICFATSTLLQGINMPFDVVWIDNFRFTGNIDKKILELKNLIGRAGRNRAKNKEFDYGYVVIPEKNYNSFLERISAEARIKNTSDLDNDLSDALPEDTLDLIEATKNDSFNDELQITETQRERLQKANLDEDIKYVLDNFFIDEVIITAADYKNMNANVREKVKTSFKNIFIQHLRRKELSDAEQSILSVALRILLWRVQGRSFSQIVAFRYNYLTNDAERNLLKQKLNLNQLSLKEYNKQLNNILLKYSQIPSQLPNKNAFKKSLFGQCAKFKDFDYDSLVYDTYEYLDTVISFSISTPISAAFQLYFNKTNDSRALAMINYLKYGTNNAVEIMLLRYGFDFEDLDWLKDYIENVTEYEITFKNSVKELDARKQNLISRYYNQ